MPKIVSNMRARFLKDYLHSYQIEVGLVDTFVMVIEEHIIRNIGNRFNGKLSFV